MTKIFTINTKTTETKILRYLNKKEHKKGALINDSQDTEGLIYALLNTSNYITYNGPISDNPKLIRITNKGRQYLKIQQWEFIAYIFLALSGLASLLQIIDWVKK